MSDKKKTGLGTSAFFKHSSSNGDQASEQVDAPTMQQAQESPQSLMPRKPKKVRTTVLIYENTLASMELLKVEARKQGVKATFSDIIGEAIQSLMEKKGVVLK